MNNRFLPLLLVLALPAACDRPAVPPAPPEVPDAPEAPPAPVVSDASAGSAPDAADAGRGGSTVTGADADQGLPDAFVVSTNEPFWNARVESGHVVLNGPDVSDRRFTVAGEENSSDARAVRARDDAGRTIEVRIAAGRCEDSMSGAVFPYRGSVAVEGGAAASGCARPAGMPAPVPSGQ
ncbi:hypothetical protein [Luteimonas sp. MC1828]|uniref:hypothetical protein n=1 Tax=Luteimonas sp. MC1828 TaxID=2799787 RepID=UPI0018F1A036|nr:hypothetical protein [Luteimonas sp. MC1828]MBJ7573924.1 hypothetical protein [Luteimonas sp. MC1828]